MITSNSVIESKLIHSHPRYLWFITLAYAMVIVLANWFDPRLINIFGLNTDAGTLIFPFTFLLSDLITEVYGFKYARRAIWSGFLFNIFFILYGQLIIHMPSPDYPTNNEMFDKVLATNFRIIFASALSYFISEPMNSMIMAKLKIKMHGRYLGIRFILSTVFSAGIDSLIFSTIAFAYIINKSNLISLILTMWLIKVAIEIMGLPISIRLAKKLKQVEQLDIYDRKTNYNLFTLDTVYSEESNEFSRQK